MNLWGGRFLLDFPWGKGDRNLEKSNFHGSFARVLNAVQQYM